MKLTQLLEAHIHTEIDSSAAIAAAINRNISKFKNIKGLSYGPGELVESISLECDREEALRRTAELDKRISAVIAEYQLELLGKSK